MNSTIKIIDETPEILCNKCDFKVKIIFDSKDFNFNTPYHCKCGTDYMVYRVNPNTISAKLPDKLIVPPYWKEIPNVFNLDYFPLKSPFIVFLSLVNATLLIYIISNDKDLEKNENIEKEQISVLKSEETKKDDEGNMTPKKEHHFKMIKKQDVKRTDPEFFLYRRVKHGNYGDWKGNYLIDVCARIFCEDCGSTMKPLNISADETFFYLWNVEFICEDKDCKESEKCVVDARYLTFRFDPIFAENY